MADPTKRVAAGIRRDIRQALYFAQDGCTKIRGAIDTLDDCVEMLEEYSTNSIRNVLLQAARKLLLLEEKVAAVGVKIYTDEEAARSAEQDP